MAASDYEVLDERFRNCVNRTSHVERLWTGARWTEGPVHFPAGRYTLFSDIPNDRIMRYDETDGSVSVFRSPCGYTNGHTVDRQGRLVSCEHGGRRVSRTEHDGHITVIADSYQGKRLNSPNDVVVKSDGSIWFTDPPYGILSDYEGHKAEPENGFNVYRVDGQSGAISVAATTSSGRTASRSRATRRSSTSSTRRAGAPRASRSTSACSTWRRRQALRRQGIRRLHRGRFDGMRFDTEGRVWAATDDGVHCLAPTAR
jgi:gluconolactonase